MWQQFLLWGKQNKIPLPNTFIYNSVLKQKLSNSISTTPAAFFFNSLPFWLDSCNQMHLIGPIFIYTPHSEILEQKKI